MDAVQLTLAWMRNGRAEQSQSLPPWLSNRLQKKRRVGYFSLEEMWVQRGCDQLKKIVISGMESNMTMDVISGEGRGGREKFPEMQL